MSDEKKIAIIVQRQLAAVDREPLFENVAVMELLETLYGMDLSEAYYVATDRREDIGLVEVNGFRMITNAGFANEFNKMSAILAACEEKGLGDAAHATMCQDLISTDKGRGMIMNLLEDPITFYNDCQTKVGQHKEYLK